MEENAFEWELTNYPLMQATVDKLNPFLGLYETSMEFMNKQKTWFESPMGTHDPKDIGKILYLPFPPKNKIFRQITQFFKIILEILFSIFSVKLNTSKLQRMVY